MVTVEQRLFLFCFFFALYAAMSYASLERRTQKARRVEAEAHIKRLGGDGLLHDMAWTNNPTMRALTDYFDVTPDANSELENLLFAPPPNGATPARHEPDTF